MRRSIPLALLGCALLTTNCASRRPSSWAAPPRLDMPAEATTPCAIYRLPASPTQADLEIGYATRGAQLAACDAARALAVQTQAAEHAMEDEVARAARAR